MAEKMAEARGEPPEGEEWPEIDRATLPIRVPDDILYRLLKEALARNDCRNRGYVLDGFPRTNKDAKYIFLKRKIVYNEDGEIEEVDEPELEEGQEKDFSGYEIDQSIHPANCIVLEGGDAEITRRIRDLP